MPFLLTKIKKLSNNLKILKIIKQFIFFKNQFFSHKLY